MTENIPKVEVGKKNKPNRKGKKAWRKNIDLEQVEEGLKLNELDQIKYGVSGSQIPDEALFEEDTVGGDKVTSSPLVKKPTYIDQVLNTRSAVPVIQSKIQAQKKSSTQASKPVIVQPQITKKFGKSKQSRKLASLWDEEETQDPEAKKISDIDSLHAPVIKRPNTMNSKPILKEDPNVIHPGYSYQPIKKHHEELKEAHQKQVENKVIVAQKWKTISDSLKAGKNETGEMDEIEYSEEEEEESDDVKEESGDAKDETDGANDEDEELIEKATSADPKRLTKTDRRKKSNLKIQKKLANRKLKKKQDNVVFTKIKSIKKEAEQTTKAIEEKIEFTKKQNEETKLQPKTRFGRYSVQSDKFEVNEEVAPTLRNIQAASNPFEQHYHKFTKKNMIERRNRVRNKKTAKVKAYTKNFAKDLAN